MLGYLPGRSQNNTGGGGTTILSGEGLPSSALGKDGDFYIDTKSPSISGPKTSGAWPSPIPFGGTTVLSRMESTDPFVVHQAGQQQFTLPVSDPSYIEMYYNGQLQPENLFTVSGSVVVVSATLGAVANDTIEFTYEVVSYSNTGPYDIPVAETPNGIVNRQNQNFTLSYIPIAGTLNVYVNGLHLSPDEYTATGQSLMINLPPNEKIFVTYYR